MDPDGSSYRRPRLDPELCEQIDELRGDVPFDPFVRRLLRTALAIEAAHSQPVMQPPRVTPPNFNRVSSLRR